MRELLEKYRLPSILYTRPRRHAKRNARNDLISTTGKISLHQLYQVMPSTTTKTQSHDSPTTRLQRALLAGGCVAGPSGVTYALVIPPSTTKSVPLTKLLSSLARKRTAWACSMASPKRPEGKWTSRLWRLAASSPSQSWRRGVLFVFVRFVFAEGVGSGSGLGFCGG